jgi:hypothetical protein
MVAVRRAYPPGVRPAHLIAVYAAIAALAGCDSGDGGGDDADRPKAAPPATEREGTASDEGRLIRDWLGALNRGDYDHAATFFVPGAVIDQGIPYRLRDRAAARLWNSGLPCRADLIEVEDEGKRVLASFRLRAGPGGPCAGIVKVRFAFRGGRFSEFRQLPGEEPEPGETV